MTLSAMYTTPSITYTLILNSPIVGILHAREELVNGAATRALLGDSRALVIVANVLVVVVPAHGHVADRVAQILHSL